MISFENAARIGIEVERVKAASRAVADHTKVLAAEHPVFTTSGATFGGDDARIMLSSLCLAASRILEDAGARLREMGVALPGEEIAKPEGESLVEIRKRTEEELRAIAAEALAAFEKREAEAQEADRLAVMEKEARALLRAE